MISMVPAPLNIKKRFVSMYRGCIFTALSPLSGRQHQRDCLEVLPKRTPNSTALPFENLCSGWWTRWMGPKN